MSHCNKRRGDLPSLPIWSTGKKGSFKHNHCLCLTNVYLSVSCGIFYVWFNPFGEKRFLKIIYVVQCSWVHLPFTEFLKATLRCNGQKLQNCDQGCTGATASWSYYTHMMVAVPSISLCQHWSNSSGLVNEKGSCLQCLCISLPSRILLPNQPASWWSNLLVVILLFS